MKKALLACAFLLLPSLTFAAGFASGSLFLSQSKVTEGDTVLIHAVVSNDGAATFSGKVVLTDAGAQVGSVPVSLAAGAAQTVSVSWTPAAGSHSIVAKLTSSDGTVVQQESQTFVVAAKPQPTAVGDSSQSAESVESSQAIQEDIANYSPQAAQAAQPAFATLDGLRASAADVLDTQITTAKNNLANTQAPGVVEGTSTSSLSNPTITNPWGTFWFVLWTLYLYILTILSWIIDNAAVFYPVLVIIFFYILWRVYRSMRRPRY